MDRLGGFEDNTWINGIGSVFKRADGSQWGINLSIYPRKTRGSDSVNIPFITQSSRRIFMPHFGTQTVSYH